MKAELKVKLLQHLNKRNREEGFTLIELLVVVIIIGILAVVALPTLLRQARKAKQVEAQNNVGSINRAQQLFYLENRGFTSSIGALGVGIGTQTRRYQYRIVTGIVAGESVAVHAACRPWGGLKAYHGQVYTTDVTSGGVAEAVTRSLLLQSWVSAPGTNDTTTPPTPITTPTTPYCGGADKLPATPGGEPPTEQYNEGWNNMGR